MNESKKKVLLIILILVSSTIFFVPGGSALKPFIAFINTFYLPGLVFLLFALNEKLIDTDLIFMPLLVSPIVTTLLVLLFFAVTHSHLLASYLSFTAVMAGGIVFVLSKKDGKEKEKIKMPTPVIFISAGFGLLVAVLYALNPFLTVRSDSWYHASVVLEILDRGIPPMEPRFPDVPIRYMWIYHLFISTWKMTSGLPVFTSLAAFNTVSAFCFPYLIARITAFFRRGTRYLIITPILAVAGLESVSWILWPAGLVRAFFGEVKGMAEVTRMMKEIKLNGSDVIQFLHPYGTWMVNLIDKFITITAFSYSLDLFALAFIVFLIGWRSSGRNIRAGSTIAALSAGTLLFHVITGSVLIITVIGSGIMAYLSHKLFSSEKPGSFLTATAPLSAIIAGLLCFKYVFSLTAGNATSNGSLLSMFHIGLRNAATILLPLLILYCPAKRALKKIFKTERRELEPYVLWIIPLLAVNILVDLPTRNESKLIFPTFIIILPPIAWEIIDTIKSAGTLKKVFLTAWTVALFGVPAVLTVRGFALERPTKSIEKRRILLNDEEQKTYLWIRKNTGTYAVVMENNIDCLAPVFAHRRSFYPPPSAINVVGYRGRKIDLYRKAKEEIFSREPLSIETIREIAEIKNDIYIVVWPADVEKNPYLKEKFTPFRNVFKKVYSTDGTTVYHFERKEIP